MANISANQWDLANFKIIPAHIMVANISVFRNRFRWMDRVYSIITNSKAPAETAGAFM